MNFLHRCRTAVLIIVILVTLQAHPRVLAQDDSLELQQNAAAYQAVSSGYKHACALTAAGKLVCWGSNAYGQIGTENYSFTARSTPGPMTGLDGETIVDFTAGGYNACVINSAGALKCWGSNNWRELGNPGYTTWASGTPIQVSGMESGVVQAAMGNGFICAGKDTGEVYCWGLDYAGGEYSANPVPVLVDQFPGLKDLQANGGHACVITGSDEVMCWGLGEAGQLGNGQSINSAAPVLVAGLDHVTSLAVGELHTCAVTGPADSQPAKAWCWGSGTYGQLGRGLDSLGSSSLPVEVQGLTGEPVAVTAGKEHSCAIVQDAGVNSVMCWGRNTHGQSGSGSTSATQAPAPVPNSTGAVAISAGEFHTNMLTGAGQIKSWGGNYEGQLGNGFFFRRQLPIHLNQIEQGLSSIVSGERHTCALTAAGGVLCWGENEYGQLGNGTTVYSSEPVQAIGLESGVTSITAGPYHTCALLQTGWAKCWGYNPLGMLGTGEFVPALSTPSYVLLDDSPEILSGITSIEAGGWHTCALMENGGAKCWGSNMFGQAGNGEVTPAGFIHYPVDVSFLGKFTSITAGTDHTCAVTDLGEVYCWGSNMNGQLGIGSSDFNPHPLPSQVTGSVSSAVDVDAGASRTCVLTSAGGVSCWGGGSNLHTPAQVPGLQSGVAAISTGGSIEYLEHHTCALMAGSGAVKCWGYNDFSQLGDGTYRFFGQYAPVDVLGLSGNVSAVTASGTSSCAFFESGSAACWGSDYQIKSEPVDLVEVDNLGRPPSIFFSNYYEGAPESYFVITGLYFPPNQPVLITINDEQVGSVTANETGVFKFFTYFDVEGEYTIRVDTLESGQSIRTNMRSLMQPAGGAVGQGELTITIQASSTPRAKEGDGFTLGLDSSIFLPTIVR